MVRLPLDELHALHGADGVDTRPETGAERAHWARFLPPAGQTVAPFDVVAVATVPVSPRSDAVKPARRRPSATAWVAACVSAAPVVARAVALGEFNGRAVPLCATTGRAHLGTPAADWAKPGSVRFAGFGRVC